MPSRVLTQFGLRDQTAEYWINQNPNFRFIGLKQTHSDILVDLSGRDPWPWPAPSDITLSNPVLPEGDGLITDQKAVALVIATADCLPILIHDPSQHRIAAVHAGWRGVVNRIFPKALQHLIGRGGDPGQFQVSIGPHIQVKDFEVGIDVAQQLILSTAEGTRALRPHPEVGKAHVDLNQLIILQAAEFQVQASQVFIDPRNTFSDQHLPSFRRDGAKAGRMLSWIALLAD